MSSAISKRLEGKTVLITGASSGIGKSTALEFARTSPKSLKLILTARRVDALKALAEEIKKEVGEGVQCLPAQLDMSKPGDIVSFVANLPAEFKDIDILVNNAGLVKGVDKSPAIKPEDIEVMFATNVTGLITMTQEVMKGMVKKGESGAGDIINIGSIAGREGYAGGSIYCATKAAVRTFTDALRRELIATRIRVIEIDPGQVETVSPRVNTRTSRDADIKLGIFRGQIRRRQGKGRCCVSRSRSIDTRRHRRSSSFCCWQKRKCGHCRSACLSKSPG